MIKQLKLSACALTVCIVTASSAFAVDSVDVKVIGTITPAACTPTLAGGGTIDYGTMNPSILAATGPTTLALKQLDFTITCDAPAAIGVTAVNGRLNTAAGTTERPIGFGTAPTGVTLLGNTGTYVAGLGLAGTDKIGGYSTQIIPGTVTGTTTAGGSVSLDSIVSNTSGPWTASTSGIMFSGGPRTISWSATGTTVPYAFQTLTGTLGVQAYIADKTTLDITKPITLDGLTTLELVYL